MLLRVQPPGWSFLHQESPPGAQASAASEHEEVFGHSPQWCLLRWHSLTGYGSRSEALEGTYKGYAHLIERQKKYAITSTYHTESELAI